MSEEIRLKNKPGRPRQKWIDNVLETVNLTKEAVATLAKESRELWDRDVVFTKEPTSCNVSLKSSEAMQWTWDQSLHNGYGYDDDD